MSILFTPFTLGSIKLKNRFVFSACEDNLADADGFITDAIIRKNQKLAKGQVALIISSQMYVHPWGQARIGQPGIHNDQTIPGLRRLARAVHREEGIIVFQLGHAGLAAKEQIIRRPPLGPSAKTSEMTKEEIGEVIQAFAAAAGRAADAGADGVQLHAAHGYLINQFLSPFFNHRGDKWGGSDENRFRLLKEIITEVKNVLPPTMALLVKLNSHDYTPQEGITPALAIHYAKRLAEESVDGIEVSCGNSSLAPWNICRGDIPAKEILNMIPEGKKSQVKETLERMKGNFKIEEGYNLDRTLMMRPVVGNTPLFAVGGWRHVEAMENAVAQGQTDLISLCRPFIREPSLVKKIREGKATKSSCINCNRCFIALAYGLPGRCYYKGLPA